MDRKLGFICVRFITSPGGIITEIKIRILDNREGFIMHPINGLRSSFIFFLLIGSAVAYLAASQATSDTDEYDAKAIELRRYYSEKNWPAALKVLEQQLKLAEADKNDKRRTSVLYNKACIYALSGQRNEAILAVRSAIEAGRTDYRIYEEDTDFDNLRNDPEFKSILSSLKAKYALSTLSWEKDRSGVEFEQTFDNEHVPQLILMRQEFEIDSVVAGAKNDYERLRRLTSWVSRQWKHSSNQSASNPDPLTILREARQGGRFICLNYAIVLAAAASAYGMPSRVLGMLPSDIETRSEAHSVAEVWIPQLEKWVLADAQWGAIAELNGTPLNAVELQRAIVEQKPIKCAVGETDCKKWIRFILPNMFYFKIVDDNRSFQSRWTRQLVLVPKGAQEPRKFAGGGEWVFSNSVYISDPDIFYKRPK